MNYDDKICINGKENINFNFSIPKYDETDEKLRHKKFEIVLKI